MILKLRSYFSSLFKRVIRSMGFEFHRVKDNPKATVVSLKTSAPAKGCVLIAYILDPFLLKKGEKISTAHTHHFESTLLVQSYLELGYDVDVIHYLNRDFSPEKKYVFYVNARETFEHLAKKLHSDCIKIVHLDTAHFLFNNFAAYKRSLELQQRRGVTVVGRTIFNPNRAIETCDYATILGNSFTVDTYRYANKKIFTLPVPTSCLFEPAGRKNFDACRKKFLWFGSRGMVHKGLDLVLEAFSRMPEYQLVVCGPFEAEPHFVEAYSEELYHTAQVSPVGWVDVTSEKFLEIVNDCVGLIYPSCAEGQAGAVITCMQAGLIPVVSYESGVDMGDYGILLKENSVSEIINAVKDLSSRPVSMLEEMSEKAQYYCRANHSGEKYLEKNKRIVKQILALESGK